MPMTDASRDHREGDLPTARIRPVHPGNVRRTLSYVSVKPSGSPARRAAITLGMAVGSALLATSGAIHLHLWAMGYRTIPTIGPLFLIQGLAGAAMAILLAVSRRLLIVVTAAGFMVATIGGYLISIYVGLFGFMDTLAAPFAAVSLGVESAGAVVLGVVGTVIVLGPNHTAQRGNRPTESVNSIPQVTKVEKPRAPSVSTSNGHCEIIELEEQGGSSVSTTIQYLSG
jgi:hypothetical protein